MDGLEDSIQVKWFCEQGRVVVPIKGQRSGGRAHENHRDALIGLMLLYFATELSPIHHRHHHIADDQIRLNSGQLVQTLLPVSGSRRLIAFIFEGRTQHIGNRTFILNYQDRLHGCCP